MSNEWKIGSKVQHIEMKWIGTIISDLSEDPFASCHWKVRFDIDGLGVNRNIYEDEVLLVTEDPRDDGNKLQSLVSAKRMSPRPDIPKIVPSGRFVKGSLYESEARSPRHQWDTARAGWMSLGGGGYQRSNKSND